MIFEALQPLDANIVRRLKLKNISETIPNGATKNYKINCDD